MISVEEADKIIGQHRRDYGREELPFDQTLGRVLAQQVLADRDLPPFNRVAMDGIAIRFDDYEAGCRAFRIAAVQAAGDAPPAELPANACIEIMTGAACPPLADTVVPYEHLRIENGFAFIQKEPLRGKNIHTKGRDKKAGEPVLLPGRLIGPTEINMAASVGQTRLWVKKLPRVAVLSSGDELVAPDSQPSPFQIRRSNSYAIQAVLRQYGIEAELLHVAENLDAARQTVADCLDRFDVLLLSGGVSMGKFDLIPQALEDCGVRRLFHKVRQRPGKPFWLGAFGEKGMVFAFPGNPVSTFLCLLRYFVPWLKTALAWPETPPLKAVLDKNLLFEAPLQYFVQVKLHYDDEARLRATPLEGHGSGDFSNLLDTQGFLELPADQTHFSPGETYPLWPYSSLLTPHSSL